MPEHITSDLSLGLNEKVTDSEHLQSDVCDQTECVEDAEYFDNGVNVGNKADSSDGLDDCTVLTMLSQPTHCNHHLTTPTPTHPEADGDGGGSTNTLNCQPTTQDKDTFFNHMYVDGQYSEETSKEVKSCKQRKKSQDGDKKVVDVDDCDGLDSGWSYMVLVGTFTVMAVVSILGPGFGILFSTFLIDMKASSTLTSAIFNLESFAWSLSNLLAVPLTEQFGCRTVGIAGGLLCFVGMAASAFVPSPVFLFFSHSMLTGFGSGSCCLAAFAVMPQYFRRLMGRANGIMTAGLCVGGMIGMPMVTYLQEQFGFKGATLIVAAFSLHICVASAVYRPVQRGSKVKVEESTVPRPGSCQLMCQMVCSLGRNCLLLKSPRVFIIAVGSSFIISIFLNMFMLVPFVMESKGYSQETAAWCMSVMNLCNLAGRLVVSSCSDMACYSVLVTFTIFSALVSVTTIMFSLVQDLMWVTVTLAVCGFCLGVCMCQMPIMMVRYMGLQLYVAVLGVTGLINGVWVAASGPFIGVIRDWSGSYTVSLCVLGASGFCATLMFLFMPFAVTHDKHQEQHQRTKDAEVGG